MGRRAGVSSDETREQLLAAAIKVFAERGYDGTRVCEIAKEAGLTTGAIYNHYSSKADLLTAAISQRGPGVVTQLLQSNDELSVLEAFRRVGAALPDQAPAASPLFMEAVVAARRDPAVATVVADSVGAKEQSSIELIRRAQADGEVDADLDAEALARYITMLGLGSLVVGALGLDPVGRDDWVTVIDRVLDAVRPTDETTDTRAAPRAPARGKDQP